MKKSSKNQKFKTERDLVFAFRSIGKDLFSYQKKNQIISFCEFEAAHGVADLVYFELRNSWNKNLLLSEVGPSWAYVFSILSNSSFSPDKLIELSGCKPIYARKILKDLEKKEVVYKLRSGNWKLKKKLIPLSRNIISVECKLKNWKKALAQAIRYQDYSNQSWVILDSGWCHFISKNVEHFKKYNVGLATINPSLGLQILFTPQTENPKHASAFWFANSVAARELIISI